MLLLAIVSLVSVLGAAQPSVVVDASVSAAQRSPANAQTSSLKSNEKTYFCDSQDPEESLRIALYKVGVETKAFRGKDERGFYTRNSKILWGKSVDEELHDLRQKSHDEDESDSYAYLYSEDSTIRPFSFTIDRGGEIVSHRPQTPDAEGSPSLTAELIINEDWRNNRACVIWAFPRAIGPVREIILDPDLPRSIRYSLGVIAGARGQMAKAVKVPVDPANALEGLSQALFSDRLDLTSVDRIFIRPGGVTAQLPFLALRYRGQPIGGRFAVVVLSSLEDVGSFKPALKASTIGSRFPDYEFQHPLVIGNPDHGWDKHIQWATIDYSSIEASNVARYFKTRPIIGADATISRIVSLMPQADYIHFASHAVSDPANPMDESFVLLSDGYLTGRMLQRLGYSFKGHPIIVLSACQTGLGKAFEGGTYGLARVLREGGASQIVGNLWNVGDTVSGRLMQRFGQFVAAGQGGEFALRDVLREAIAEYPDTPAYWGSFVLYGISSADCYICTKSLPPISEASGQAAIGGRVSVLGRDIRRAGR